MSRARNGLSGLSHRTVAQCVEVLTQWNLVAGARGPGIAQRCKHCGLSSISGTDVTCG